MQEYIIKALTRKGKEIQLVIKSANEYRAQRTIESCYPGIKVLEINLANEEPMEQDHNMIEEPGEETKPDNQAILKEIEGHSYLTVKQYATLENISVQAVYKRLRKKENKHFIIRNTSPLKIKKAIIEQL